jgi:uncharacterized Ntn-hydrolase superfamily protein
VTYSIVARDPVSGQLGVAVQSCWPMVGAVVSWAEPGVGAVATQSFTEVGYGPRGLDLLRAGSTAADALATLVAADSGEAVRQVAIIDRSGSAAAHTGARCIAEAGHLMSDGVSVQANMMERPTVWPAMLDAWLSTDGDLADRFMAVLRAAETEGGDVRGRQSAAMLIVGAERTDRPWDRLVDLRVDDSPEPLDELARLLRLHRGFEAMDEGEQLAMAGNLDAAAAAFERANELAPDDDQVGLAWVVARFASGRGDGVRDDARRIIGANPRWPLWLRRMADSGMLTGGHEVADWLDQLG